MLFALAFGALSLGQVAAAARAQVYKQWTVWDGHWYYGYKDFDWHVIYRWPANARSAQWTANSNRARACFIGLVKTDGKGPVYTRNGWNYIEITAGGRARILYPLMYGQAPYYSDSQRNVFANDLGIEYR